MSRSGLKAALATLLVLTPASTHADGVLWGQEDGVLVFYPLTTCATPPTGTRAICFNSVSGTLNAVQDDGTLVDLEGGGGGGAPDSAQYWVGAADATLTAEKNLGVLGTGFVINTAGVPTVYAGSTPCVAQFVRTISASGVTTCESIVIADLPAGIKGWTDDGVVVRLTTATDDVGIGTAAPALTLETMGAAGAPATSGTAQTGIARFSNSIGNGVMDTGFGGSTGYAWLQGTNSGNLSIEYPIILNPNGGGVGIGFTTEPAAQLAVNGGVHVGGSTDPGDNNLWVDGKERINTQEPTVTDLGAALIAPKYLYAVEGTSGAPVTGNHYRTPMAYFERWENSSPGAGSSPWANDEMVPTVLIETKVPGTGTGTATGLAVRTQSNSNSNHEMHGIAVLAETHSSSGANKQAWAVNAVTSWQDAGTSPVNLVGVEVDVINNVTDAVIATDNFTAFWAQTDGTKLASMGLRISNSGTGGSGWRYGVFGDTKMTEWAAYFRNSHSGGGGINVGLLNGALTGTALSKGLVVGSGALGTTLNDELPLGNIGFLTGNAVSLAVRGYRTAAGADWTTTALGLSMDVDNTVRGGATIWLHANKNVGVGSGAVLPTHTLDVAPGAAGIGCKNCATERLMANVPVAVSASYVTIFTIQPPASKNNALSFRMFHTASANTIGVQWRVRSADTGNVGGCNFTHYGINATVSSNVDTFSAAIAIAAAPADSASLASFTTAFNKVDIDCVFTSDATPGTVILEAQLETGTASINVLSPSYYNLVTN